jgi:integrase
MATIRKHRDKYQVQIRRKGFCRITKTFIQLADAKEWARLQERLADRAELGTDRRELDRLTLGGLIKRYLEEVIPTKRHRETDTFSLNLLLAHRISRRRLSELTPADFSRYRDERLKSVSPATLKRQFSPLRHMLGHARDEWDIPLKGNLLSKTKFLGADTKRNRRLREGELRQLFEAGEKTRNPFILPVIRLAVETAMRRGEILDLRYRDIDIENCSATVRMSKNGYSRTIPLSSLAVAILETNVTVMSKDAKDRNEHLFPITPVALRLAWDRLIRRAKIENLHFHDLRHEAISRFFEKGLTVPEVASISGHRDIRMLLRYAHADRRKVAEKLNL